MKHSLSLTIITLLCTLTVPVAAQDTQWSFNKGNNVVEVTSAGIHVKQRDAKDTNAFALARKKLILTDKAAWRVAFDVRYGQVQPVASTVKLGIEDTLIGAVAADEKGLRVYLGNDTVKVLQPIDDGWHHFEFICDGFTSSAWHNGVKVNEEPTQGTPNMLIVGAWSEGKWLSRQGELWMRNLEVSTSAASSLVPLPALSADAVTIPLRPDDASITCQVGDHLQIAGSVTMRNTFDTSLLLADGVVASTRTPSVPTDNYSFTWTPKTSGTHTLELRYTTLHSKVSVRRLLVTAEDAPPAVLTGSSLNAGVDTAVAVVGAGPSPFPIARVDFYFNDKPLAVVTSAPFATTLPIAATNKPGIYPVKFIAYDGAGRPFYAHASKIEVPQRVQVTAPRALTLRNAGDKANLTASVLPGVTVAKISYTIAHANSTDYQVVADATTAPFSAAVDLSSRASGDYWVNAIVTSVAGNVYEAWAVPLALTNVPDDARKVQEAKDKAIADAKAAAVAAAVAAENAKWNADSLSSNVLDANADAAYRKGLIKVSLVDDPAKIGTEYYVTVKIQNLGDTPIHIFPPSILFDDFSSMTLYPAEQDAADIIFVNINSRGNRQVQLKAHISSTDMNSSRKPIRIKFLSIGIPVLSLPL